MFNKISRTYDFLNLLLSFGLDRYWRWRAARWLDPKRHGKILDCATGTGDQLFAFLKRARSSVEAIGIDPAANMLVLAKEKCARRRLQATFVEGRADALPFVEASFDLLSMSFGIRNVEDVARSLAEMRRVMKPGGRMLILEFSLPSSRLFKTLHLFYLHRVLPLIGRWISGHDAAYTYLANTITTFPYGENFCRLVEEAGFSTCACYPLTMGIVSLYVAETR